ncbi:MAG: hypothetical protein WC494_00710 [Candidatus Pacearchaeota archaeon]
MEEVRNRLIEDLEKRGLMPVLGLHIFELPKDVKAKWVQNHRRGMGSYYSNEGRIILECNFGLEEGLRRAMRYIHDYGTMTDEQIIDLYIREMNISGQELREESKFLAGCEEESMKRTGDRVIIT